LFTFLPLIGITNPLWPEFARLFSVETNPLWPEFPRCARNDRRTQGIRVERLEATPPAAPPLRLSPAPSFRLKGGISFSSRNRFSLRCISGLTDRRDLFFFVSIHSGQREKSHHFLVIPLKGKAILSYIFLRY